MDLGKLRRTPLHRELFEESPLLPKNLTVPIQLTNDESVDPIIDRLMPLYEKGLRSIYLSPKNDAEDLELLTQVSSLLTTIKNRDLQIFAFLNLPQSISAQETMRDERSSLVDALVLSRQQIIDANSGRERQPNNPLFFLSLDASDTDAAKSINDLKNLDGLCFQSLPSRAHGAKQLVKEHMLPAVYIHSEEYTASLRETASNAQLDLVELCHESLTALRRAGAHCIVSDLCYEKGIFEGPTQLDGRQEG